MRRPRKGRDRRPDRFQRGRDQAPFAPAALQPTTGEGDLRIGLQRRADAGEVGIRRIMPMPGLCRLDGIDPPGSILSNDELMLWPDGRTVAFTPFFANRSISALYGRSTFRLSAFGCFVLASHQTCSTESLTRTLRTVTHSAGTGIFAGLYQ